MTGPSLYDLYTSQTSQTSGQPASLYDAYKASQNAPTHDYHAEFKSGALQQRMAGANARDAANVADEQGAEPGYLERAATHVLNTAQGIPGMEAVEAGAGALGSHLTGHPMGYGQSLDALRGNTSQIGGKTNVAEHVMGGLATVPFLPASAAKAGAVLGGADAALSADPDESLAARAGKTALGATVGAGVGKAGEMAVTAGRALFDPSVAGGQLLRQAPDIDLFARKAARAKSAGALYRAALNEGQGRTATPAIQSFVAEPDIAEIVSELQQTRQFKNVEPHAPEMLDAIYKTLSDRAQTIKKGLDAVSPTRPNIGRFRGEDIAAAKTDALDAMSGGMSAPGPMPNYKVAVADYAQKTRELAAYQKAYDVLLLKTKGTLPSARNLTRLTPAALADASTKMNPDEVAAAGDGVLGGANGALREKPWKMGRHAVAEAPAILRSIGSEQQRAFDRLLKAGLITANGSTQ